MEAAKGEGREEREGARGVRTDEGGRKGVTIDVAER